MNGSSEPPVETPLAMTETILEWVEPGALPLRVQEAMSQMGPFLCRGYTHAEIGAALGKSEDWASSRVREARQAIAVQVLEAGR